MQITVFFPRTLCSLVLYSDTSDEIVQQLVVSRTETEKHTPAAGRYAPSKPSVCDEGRPTLLCTPEEFGGGYRGE